MQKCYLTRRTRERTGIPLARLSPPILQIELSPDRSLDHALGAGIRGLLNGVDACADDSIHVLDVLAESYDLHTGCMRMKERPASAQSPGPDADHPIHERLPVLDGSVL